MLRLFVPPSNLRCNRQILLTYSKCQKLNISSFVCIPNTKCHPSKMYEERQSKEREREREKDREREEEEKSILFYYGLQWNYYICSFCEFKLIWLVFLQGGIAIWCKVHKISLLITNNVIYCFLKRIWNKILYWCNKLYNQNKLFIKI